MKNLFTKKNAVLLFSVASIGMYSCKGKNSNDAADSTTVFKDSSESNLSFQNELLDTLHLCTEMLPPLKTKSGLTTTSDTSIYFRNNKINDTIITNTIESFPKNRQAGPFKSAAAVSYVWPKKTLTVMFLDGDTLVQRRVMNTAREWEHYCGIRFLFGIFPTADITISFKYKGSWSYIGSYSAANSPSMNFGWLYAKTGQEEYNRVVLHEFGHAIGFIHEHQNPKNNPIQWNKPLVYAYYAAPPNNWDKNDVDNNIFLKYSVGELNSTSFDPNSIMLYAFPASLTTNNVSTHANSKISELDKKLAVEMYPISN